MAHFARGTGGRSMVGFALMVGEKCAFTTAGRDDCVILQKGEELMLGDGESQTLARS